MITESKIATIKHISRGVVAMVIAFVIIMSGFAISAFADMSNDYNVTIDDNGNVYSITTDETEPIEILSDANITLGANDKLNISNFSEGVGGTIQIDRLNAFNIKTPNTIQTYNVYANTVGEALTEIGFDTTGCKLSYNLNELVVNGMVIELTYANIITINADNKTTVLNTASGTVGDMLNQAGIVLGAMDYTEPALNTPITSSMTINVYRVEVKNETKKESVNFETVKKKSRKLNEGETKVQNPGQNGEKETNYEVTYINGKESSRKVISSNITKQPINRVEVYGTKKKSAKASYKTPETKAETSSNGVTHAKGVHVGQKISGRYSHYCTCAKCCGKSDGITASGIKIQNGMDDPHYAACNWLPLGSVIEINGTQYTIVDRGGSKLSKQGRVDIFTPAGHEACIQKGAGSCTITIVRLGW